MPANLMKRPKFRTIAFRSLRAKQMARRILETFDRNPHSLLDDDAQEMARFLHSYLLRVRVTHERRLMRVQNVPFISLNLPDYSRWRICEGDAFLIAVFVALSIFDGLVHCMDLSVANYLMTKKEYENEMEAIEGRIGELVQPMAHHVL